MGASFYSVVLLDCVNIKPEFYKFYFLETIYVTKEKEIKITFKYWNYSFN